MEHKHSAAKDVLDTVFLLLGSRHVSWRHRSYATTRRQLARGDGWRNHKKVSYRLCFHLYLWGTLDPSSLHTLLSVSALPASSLFFYVLFWGFVPLSHPPLKCHLITDFLLRCQPPNPYPLAGKKLSGSITHLRFFVVVVFIVVRIVSIRPTSLDF